MICKWFNKNSIANNEYVKILFPCKFLDGKIGVESLWCKKEGIGYKVDNIPFYVNNIANGDIIRGKRIEGELWYEDIIKASGNSVVQIIILNKNSKTDTGELFEELGCTWEGSERKELLSINIPIDVDYRLIKELLENGRVNGKWDYKEACLGWK